MVLEGGVAFLQALAVRGVRLQGQAPRQPMSEVPSILRERKSASESDPYFPISTLHPETKVACLQPDYARPNPLAPAG
jgi:hypothetical protein